MNTLILEQAPQGEIVVDVYEKLMKNRILVLSDYLTDSLACELAATIIMKASEDNSKKISLFINCIGANIRNVLMLYDVIQTIECPFETVCMGTVRDEASLLLMCGSPGYRKATKNSLISIGPLTAEGTLRSDLVNAEIIFNRMNEDNKKMMSIIAKCSGKSISKVVKDFNKDVYFSAEQAKEYGMIDEVISYAKK